MKKIPTLFVKLYDDKGRYIGISRNVTPGMEWVLNGEGIATIKYDGACCAIIGGKFYKRFDAKNGRKIPDGAIPCQETPDPITGHWPHWVAVDSNNPADKWFVEIDKRILSGASNLSFTSKELTALLLHEVGHIVYSNSIPQRISRVMRLEYARANIGTKQLLKDKIFSQILSIPILSACMYDNYRTKDNIKEELKADVFAVKMGYGDELDSALNKLIGTSTAKPANQVNVKSDKVYSDMRSVTKYSIQTIENLKERKKSIAKSNFKKLLMDSPSKYLSDAIGKVQNLLVNSSIKEMPDDMKMERVADRMDDIIEAFYESTYMTEGFFGKKKLDKIDPKIPDMIKIQIDGLKSNDERALLVSYIHDKISMIDYYLEIIETGNKKYEVYNTKEELIRMRTKLEGYLKAVMEKKIPEFSYRFYVQYPEGFEG